MTEVTPSDRPVPLPAALRETAAEVIGDVGLGGFSLREVARRAGVSHAAPGYHFGDARGLLTSLAVEGLQTLHREMATAAAAVDDPIERLTAIGRAYVRVGINYPAHCEVVFREDVIDPDDHNYQEAGLCAFGVLLDTVAEIAATLNPDLPVNDAAKLCWSAMQGLVELHTKMTRMDLLQQLEASSTEELVERFTTLLINGMLARGSSTNGLPGSD